MKLQFIRLHQCCSSSRWFAQECVLPKISTQNQKVIQQPDDQLLQLRILGFGLRQDGVTESASNNDSPNLHPVFLCERWNDTVQAQVRD
jgi:hypothetical protein